VQRITGLAGKAWRAEKNCRVRGGSAACNPTSRLAQRVLIELRSTANYRSEQDLYNAGQRVPEIRSPQQTMLKSPPSTARHQPELCCAGISDAVAAPLSPQVQRDVRPMRGHPPGLMCACTRT
jgi:hypothetical protein